MVVQYEDLTQEQKEILHMITENCKKNLERFIEEEPEIETIDTYVIEIKLEGPLL